ncbi:MAG: hypothetical protein JWM91_2357 [Rhodospirillales bacterium]|nr:hypothetical protein [Rhodospirillales bacterium]
MPMITHHTAMHADAMSSGLGRSSADTLASARAPLLFGVRLWASVCLALFVAFWLQLDNPFWAGISAAVLCQPQLGASLRKGCFRMIYWLAVEPVIGAERLRRHMENFPPRPERTYRHHITTEHLITKPS